MNDIAIRVEKLGKRYRIGKRERYKTLRDTLADTMTAPFRRLRGPNTSHGNGDSESFWALRDISFEIPRGEVVGVIGKNGAGKSTLLKVLSRITEPTEGRAEIRGRVGSLLEVGTGFHPELTGRENIYLNGAILGMRKAEIARKFDEIVTFAEIEKFLDTPVKHYSSGMYMRLAFAVAAHLEPEILLIDEVLAVGDAAFQKKCLGKLGEVARQGRTVFFVSHNLAAIASMCGRALVLSQGAVASLGEVQHALSVYRKTFEMQQICLEPGRLFECEVDNRSFQVTRVELLDETDHLKPTLATWDYVRFRVHYHATCAVARACLDFRVTTLDGAVLMFCATQPDNSIPISIEPGVAHVDCVFPQWPLAGGSYLIAAALAVPMVEYLTPLEDLAVLQVQARPVFGEGTRPPDTSRTLLVVPHEWVV